MSVVETRLSALKPIYNPQRALEHIQGLADIAPVRLFAILFPLWEIEINATQEEKRPYELMERYVERGLDEGQLQTVEELVAFFGLQREMVIKILSFLEVIGHVEQQRGRWKLTSLGYRSVREGKKYVEQEKRIKLYFDGYTSLPLRQEHYSGTKVHMFSPDEAGEITLAKSWGYRFRRITSIQEWQPASLTQLAQRTDREIYNIPYGMQNIQMRSVRPAYLPLYIIETKRLSSASMQTRPQARPHYLVYSGIRDLHDTYLEGIINNNSIVYAALRGEKSQSQQDNWREWMSKQGIIGVPLERADGTWQISLPRSTFEGPHAKFTTAKVGEYDLWNGYFIQIWCDDKTVRCRAVLDRVAKMVKSQHIKGKAIEEQLQLLASQLQTDNVDLDDLRRRAVEASMDSVIKALNRLQQ